MARPNAHGEESLLNLMRFWSDLNMWNKFGLAFIGGLVILGIVMWAINI